MNKLILSLAIYFVSSLNVLNAQCNSGFDWSHTNCTAYGVCDGTITIFMPDGGTPPYTFGIDNGTLTTQTVNDVTYTFTGLCADTYNLFAWDSSNTPCTCITNCGGTSTPTVTITQPNPPPLLVECSVILPTCTLIPYSPSFVVTFSGGVGPYTVNGNSATSPYQSNEAYCYYVPDAFVEDSAGQSVSASCVVSSDGGSGTCHVTPTPSYKIIPTCKGVCGAELHVYFSSFESGAPYEVYINSSQYMFSTITDTVKLTGLCEGEIFDIYAYGTGAHTCPAWPNTGIQIASVGNPTISTNSKEVSCFDVCDGEITIVASSGTSPYTYSINGGGSYATNNTFSLLCNDIYNCIIKDKNGCVSSTNQIEITNPEELVFTVTQTTDVDCFGENTGAIDISISGGTGVYTYEWSNNETAEDIFGLLAGDYEVVVKDENNCEISELFTISEPDELVASGNSTDEIIGADGTIALTVSDEVAPYEYVWAGPNSFSSQDKDLSGLFAGVYEVTITDDNDCVIMLEVTVGSQLNVIEQTKDKTLIVFPNPNKGRFTLKTALSDKSATYTVWSPEGKIVLKGNISSDETAIDISESPSGVYVLEVKTQTGVKYTRSITIK